jgi:protein-S-isoprenylcysteine O-methyltransferase Ste14
MSQISYLIVAISLIVWCIIHSFLISNKFISIIKSKLGTKYRFYRLAYNLFSLVTFVPIILYSESIKGDYIFVWSGYLQIIRGAILLISIFLFIAGAKHYDGTVFLGIRQIKYLSNQKSLTDSGNLDVKGILSVLRHPWYSATILLLWSRNINMNIFIVNVILTSYLIIGSYLEEKKLIIEFGEKYRLYQQNVSMLFPYKWLKSKIIG